MQLVLPNPVLLAKAAREKNPQSYVLGFLLLAGVTGVALWQADKARKRRALETPGEVGKDRGPLYDVYTLSNDTSASYQISLPTGSHIRVNAVDAPSSGYFWTSKVLSGGGSVEVELERVNGNVTVYVQGKSAGPAKVVLSLIGPDNSIVAGDTLDVIVG